MSSDLEYELNHGPFEEMSRMTWATFRERYEEKYLSGRPSSSQALPKATERFLSPSGSPRQDSGREHELLEVDDEVLAVRQEAPSVGQARRAAPRCTESVRRSSSAPTCSLKAISSRPTPPARPGRR